MNIPDNYIKDHKWRRYNLESNTKYWKCIECGAILKKIKGFKSIYCFFNSEDEKFERMFLTCAQVMVRDILE